MSTERCIISKEQLGFVTKMIRFINYLPAFLFELLIQIQDKIFGEPGQSLLNDTTV